MASPAVAERVAPDGALRPAFGAPLGASSAPHAWMLEELVPFEPGTVDDVVAYAPAGPSPDELRAMAQAAREAEIEAERERIRREAYAAGHADGEAAGRASEAARLATVVQAAEEALERVREGEARWQGNIEENLCALAVAVARQIVGRELHADAAAVTDLVRRALAEIPVDQPVAVRLNPADLALLAAAHPTTGAGAVAPNREARWVADPTVLAGGCVVEGRERIIDGRVDTALERLYRRLTQTHA
ncbi:MAG TPA: FliH/SctL family protein [Gemmatimonadaceae bacterium]|nr:FliH/SctL family protein [Gemmatimonadaceae bacterium]